MAKTTSKKFIQKEIAARSIADLLKAEQSKSAAVSDLIAAAEPYEKQALTLWNEHGQQLGNLTRVRFNIGKAVSAVMKLVEDHKYKGGFKQYHSDRNILIPRSTCLRYVSLYQDVACLNLNDDVLEAAFNAGIDLTRTVGKIKLAKDRVQKMSADQFVAFLQQKTTRTTITTRTKSEWIDEGMDALKRTFSKIENENLRNQVFLGVAEKIVVLAETVTGTKLVDFSMAEPYVSGELQLEERLN
jgi:hypothetical protein